MREYYYLSAFTDLQLKIQESSRNNLSMAKVQQLHVYNKM